MIRALHDTQGRCILALWDKCTFTHVLLPVLRCCGLKQQARCDALHLSCHWVLEYGLSVWFIATTHTLQGTAKGEGFTFELINTVTTPHTSRHSLWMYSTRYRVSLGFILFPLNLHTFRHTCYQVKSDRPCYPFTGNNFYSTLLLPSLTDPMGSHVLFKCFVLALQTTIISSRTFSTFTCTLQSSYSNRAITKQGVQLDLAI